MSRVTIAVARHRRKKRLMKAAEGYWGSHSKLLRSAKDAVKRAMRFSFYGRKIKKRDYRALWITRINAACRESGITYSRFIHALKKAGIELDRKLLAEIAVSDAKGFNDLVALAKQA